MTTTTPTIFATWYQCGGHVDYALECDAGEYWILSRSTTDNTFLDPFGPGPIIADTPEVGPWSRGTIHGTDAQALMLSHITRHNLKPAGEEAENLLIGWERAMEIDEVRYQAEARAAEARYQEDMEDACDGVYANSTYRPGGA